MRGWADGGFARALIARATQAVCEMNGPGSRREALDGGLTDVKGWRQLGEQIRRVAGEDPHIVFEHAGRETFAAFSRCSGSISRIPRQCAPISRANPYTWRCR